MSLLARELVLFRLAAQFLTRIPFGRNPFSPELMSASRRYFPAVGAVVGSLGALTHLAASLVFPPLVAAIAATGITLLATGAFHEDGLADTFDGFGARNREAALAVIRDSRVGTFGASALGIALGLKIATLAALPATAAAASLVSAHGLSRLSSLVAAGTSRPVQDEGTGEFLRGPTGAGGIAVATATGAGCLALAAAISIPAACCGLAALIGGHLAMRRLSERRLGGYTGDTLGAVQQGSEVGFHLGMAAWL